jgi:hypothetical protein
MILSIRKIKDVLARSRKVTFYSRTIGAVGGVSRSMKNELTRAGLTGRRTVSSIAGRSESKSAFDYIGAAVTVTTIDCCEVTVVD